MKKLMILLLFVFMQISISKWRVLWNPSDHLFVSQGVAKSDQHYTGTLGLHYYFVSCFGVSVQTNFINEFGWYQDFAVPVDDFKLNASFGYSPVYNSFSASLRINYLLSRFKY